MEIPYIVTPRKDTGLFNSKIAIWLFLASEVMLFGGFFSAYVFLRLGADFPWPERALPVVPGLINTFVLIASSVTVVFAWAGLKLRNWRQFQLCMAFTVACAGIFMGLKAIEYKVKLQHQAVRLTDFSVVEGHLGYEMKPGVDTHKAKFEESEYERDYKGRKKEENLIRYETHGITFSTVRFHKPWVKELLDQAGHHHAKVTLASDLEVATPKGKETIKAGEALSVELLEKIQSLHIANRTRNGNLRMQANRAAWAVANATTTDDVKDYTIASMITLETKDGQLHAKFDGTEVPLKESQLFTEVPNVAFKVEPAIEFEFKPADINESKGTLRDDTALEGKLLDSPMVFHYVDAYDFRHVAIKAKEKGVDPVVAIDNCWLVKNVESAKEAWEWNKAQMKKLEAELIQQHGYDKKTGKPNREPTFTERYRIGWQDFAAKQEHVDREKEGFVFSEQILGPDYEARHDKHTFPQHVKIPREHVMLESKFAPKWNTYYAIYFTMTGLHGLHVIGGALVLAYYLFRGKKMYDTNPEWLANRVEVGGLFWHFVDLVWIFLFPILYLM